MICGSCKKETYHIQVKYDKDGNRHEACAECGVVGYGALPDVYLEKEPGIKTNMNLCDKKTGRPIPYTTKREKHEIMKRLNVQEAGDRYHGGR